MPYYGSTRATIRWNGDDTFTSYEQPSESTVFKGELFKEKERVFLRRTLRRTQVSFPIGGQATVQLVVQVFWQPEAADFKFKGKGGRPGRFVTLLHDAQGPISDAWAWIKLVRPLYRRGFSVILPNLPGCGGSAANADTNAKYSEWADEDWRIVEVMCRNLYVNRTHIVAMGRSARVLMKFARFTKIDDGSSFLAKENCWFQPDIDFFAMFHDVVGDCPPGHKKEWYASATHQHAHLLREVLKHLRLLSFFDEASAPTEIQETHRTMVNALDDEACLAEFFDVRVSREDICAARAHAALPVQILAATSSLLDTIADFLWTGDRAEGEQVPPPRYVPHNMKMQADIETDLSKCSVGCVNPEKGLHHWNCPNHPKNKDRLRFKLMMEAQMASTPEKKPGPQRPASAPVRRPVGHEEWSGNRPPVSPSLGAARSRRGTELIWTTSSQKGPVTEVKSHQARTSSCAQVARELNPPILGVAQHQDALRKLPTHLRRVTITLKQECEAKEEERVEEELRKQEVLSPMGSPMPSPKGAKSPQSQSLPSPSIDGTNSEIFPEEDFLVARGSLNAERALRASHDDPLLPSEKALSRSASKLSKHSKQSVPVSGGGSDIAFGELEVDYVMTPPGSPTMLARFPSKPSLLAQDSPIRGNSKLSASFRPDVEVRDVTGEDRGLMLLKDLSPPSTPASLSRPSSAKRLSNYFSSKLNRLSRPASALLRRSSSATFSDSSPGSGAASPQRNRGSLGSWFHDRRSQLVRS